MGYALYDTPMGEAGYSVEDTCHREGCSEEIDRGLSFLCGSTPGTADEYGCGKWFCGDHLLMPPAHIELFGGGVCEECWDKNGWDDDDDIVIEGAVAG